MAHESFEDNEIADILNRHFISIKVDKEERPDIDSVYMSVCQAFTGSGGWPTSIFMTADKEIELLRQSIEKEKQKKKLWLHIMQELITMILHISIREVNLPLVKFLKKTV